MRTDLSIITAAQDAVTYEPGQAEQLHPLTAAEAKQLPKRTRNFRKASEPTPDLAGWLVVRKARARRVLILGEGTRTVHGTSGAIVTPITGVRVSAAEAAALAGLTPQESAAFVARFPSDGTAAPAPTDAALVAAAFRKVNALRGGKVVSVSKGAAATEVLA